MTKKQKSMTIILIIIVVIVLMYVVAWVRVAFIAGVFDLGWKKTYTPKYGLPFVWVVTTTRDTTLPKLSSGETPPPYEVNILQPVKTKMERH